VGGVRRGGRPITAALRYSLNFFLMGAGTAYNGRRMAVGIGLTIGAIALTYVEMNLQPLSAQLYRVMFGTVLMINAFLAYDGYSEAVAINAKRMP
jgi:hypothetical protein